MLLDKLLFNEHMLAGPVIYSMYDWIKKDSNRVTPSMKEFLMAATEVTWTANLYSRSDLDTAKTISAAFNQNMTELLEALGKCNIWYRQLTLLLCDSALQWQVCSVHQACK